MEGLFGYGIVGIYMALLLLTGKVIGRRFPSNNQSLNEYLFAGKQVPFGLLAPSIFTSWLWVTTIVGSGEAGFRYGISGGMAYSLGAAMGFALLIPVLVKMKRLMPESVTFIDFIGVRYNAFLKDLYYVFALLVAVYVIVEQSAGIALVFNGLFLVSFKKIAFITVILCGIYVVWRGMRGVLYNELFNFFLISICLLAFILFVIRKFDIPELYQGLSVVQSNAENNNYNPEALNLLSKSGIMYAFLAVMIALGQILLDPGYYMKAHAARDEKTIIRSFFTGGVLIWSPIAILSSFVIGYATLSQNFDFSKAVNVSIAISTKVITEYFGPGIQVLFAFLIFCIGCTSIIHCLIGIQSLFTLNFYNSKLKADAAEEEKLKFGRLVSLLIAFLCALISIALEKVSLLTIDTFSGIFFAAPCGAIIMGILSKKEMRNTAWISILLGIGSGFFTWLAIPDEEWNYFYGIGCSFFIPILFLMAVSFVTQKKFNFKKLLFFKE